jgi:hypothetical protein
LLHAGILGDQGIPQLALKSYEVPEVTILELGMIPLEECGE